MAVKSLKLLPNTNKALEYYNSHSFLEKLKKITNIQNLEEDPYLNGAGLHLYNNGDFLCRHLDYSVHPVSGKERRINLIIYVSDWKEEYGGALLLYDSEGNITKKIYPKKNRAVIFETNDFSFHGVEKITCPETVTRKLLSIFYVSEKREGITVRKKAQFFSENYKNLCSIRSERLLNKSDF